MIQYETDIDYEMIQDENQCVHDLIDYITKKEEGSLVDYIIEFSDNHNYKIEEVADLIKQDNFLKQIVELDCERNNIFRTEDEKLGNW